MSVQSCNGKDEHGDSCSCLRIIRRQDQEPDMPVICRDCGHTESAHPAPALTTHSIITGYRDAARTGVKASLKTSAQDAIKETASGLKRPKDSDCSEGPSKKKGKSKAASAKSKEDRIFIGSLGIIPDGLDEHGDLVRVAAPNLGKQSNLESQGLLVDGGAEKSLFILSSWTAAEVVEWLREKLPGPFEWLDANVLPPDPQYRLLIKIGAKFSLCGSTAPTGYELNKYKGGNGKSWMAKQIWLVSSIEIPYEVYSNNWQPASPTIPKVEVKTEEELTALSEYEDEGSSDTVKRTPPLKTRAAARQLKGKGKAVPKQVAEPIVIDSDGDSDITPPPPHIAFAIRGGRSLSPGFAEGPGSLFVPASPSEGPGAPATGLAGETQSTSGAGPSNVLLGPSAAGASSSIPSTSNLEALTSTPHVVTTRKAYHLFIDTDPYLQLSDDLTELAHDPWA